MGLLFECAEEDMVKANDAIKALRPDISKALQRQGVTAAAYKKELTSMLTSKTFPRNAPCSDCGITGHRPGACFSFESYDGSPLYSGVQSDRLAVEMRILHRMNCANKAGAPAATAGKGKKAPAAQKRKTTETAVKGQQQKKKKPDGRQRMWVRVK